MLPEHSKHQAKRPRAIFGYICASPELGLLFQKRRTRSAETQRMRMRLGAFFVCSTLRMACTGMAHERLLPCAICVQRFGNRMILQLIPLIARCCVLQRNRKPSHPSRHVVGAVVNPGGGRAAKCKIVLCETTQIINLCCSVLRFLLETSEK